jgi:hypothetical protein
MSPKNPIRAVFPGGCCAVAANGARTNETGSENDREPDRPHRHLPLGMSGGSLADLNYEGCGPWNSQSPARIGLVLRNITDMADSFPPR